MLNRYDFEKKLPLTRKGNQLFTTTWGIGYKNILDIRIFRIQCNII